MARTTRYRLALHLVLLAIVVGVVVFAGTRPRASEAGTTFYVDAISGNDRASGTSPSTAWKTLGKVNKERFKPGDQILLMRGSVFSEPLLARWTGSDRAPILVDAYGVGPAPLIQNQRNGNIRVTGSYISIGHLSTVNTPASYGAVDPGNSSQPLGWVVGVNLMGADHVTIHDMSISHEAVAIAFKQNCHDIRVLHNQLTNNDGAWKPSTDPNGIRGGTGVLLEGTNNEIGWNTFSGNSTLINSESISIELYTASKSLIHYNTSRDKDFVETGSDKKFISRNNRILFNQFSATQWATPVFVNTRGKGDKFGPVYSTVVENNSVYVTGSKAQGVVCAKCGPDILTLRDNIIVAQQKAVYVDTAQPNEGHNIFWSPTGSQHSPVFTQNMHRSSTDQVTDPMFVDAARGDFRLQVGSPAAGLGSTARRDFADLLARTVWKE